jgi:hypothetical protein
VDAKAWRRLFQVLCRGADIGLAAVGAVGDEHDVEAGDAFRALGGRLDERRGDRLRWHRLETVQQLGLLLGGEFAGLRQDLSVGAYRRLPVAKGHETERDLALVVAKGLGNGGAGERNLALAADLGPHAA